MVFRQKGKERKKQRDGGREAGRERERGCSVPGVAIAMHVK